MRDALNAFLNAVVQPILNSPRSPFMTNQYRLFASLALALGIGVGLQTSPARSSEPNPPLPTITLNVGGQSVKAEVAVTDETRQKGLMFREKMAKNSGMLFVFPDVAYHSMWMRNTPLPLAVAFVDTSGIIVSIHEMQPHTDESHMAAGPVKYALEVNSGWFNRNNVKTGDEIKGLAKAPKVK